jgi:hypothetical protein
MVAADQLLREPEPAALPRGWRPCKGCGLAVPVRETCCSLRLWERWVAGKEAGWRCVQCGQMMTGRRLHARYCSPACTRKARYSRWVAAGRPYRAGRWATVASGGTVGLPDER